jgi:hypothetical protein
MLGHEKRFVQTRGLHDSIHRCKFHSRLLFLRSFNRRCEMSWFSALGCKALKVLHVRNPHNWSKPQQKDGCIYIQTCLRCGEEREVAVHRFGEWRYKEPDSCTKVRTCQKCGKKETGIFHATAADMRRRSEYREYKSPNSCIMVTKCRCGIILEEDHEPSHSFVDGRCRRCGEQEHIDDSGGGDDDPNPDLGHRGPLGYSGYG